ncbi:MAG: 23S rRNA (uracil(1939)-C(5))-methyltransferase RlmD [Pseudomonadota bacterium]
MPYNSHNNVLIENLSHDGRGICHIDGKITFVANALPSEIVELKIIKRKNKFNEAIANKINSSSVDRVTPKCDFYTLCGGCSLQHLAPKAQILHKQKALLEQLQHFANVQPKQILSPLYGPSYGYRHKARLSVRFVKKKNRVLVGFREKQSHYVCEMSHCDVLKPEISDLIMPLRELITNLSNKESIAQIEVAADAEKLCLVLRNLTAFTRQDIQALKNFAANYRIHLYIQPGDYDSIELVYPEAKTTLLKQTLVNYQLELFYQPIEFSQVNPYINEKMIQQALGLLQVKTDERVLDFFCGFGNFTLPLARQAEQVIGIEANEKAIKRAKMNAEHNQLSNVEFHAADLRLDQQHRAWTQGKFAKILLDPPRSGALELLPLIAKLNPQRIVYVSCNPATLARDIGKLVHEHQYQLDTIGIMDMFANTSHIESMALLTKN